MDFQDQDILVDYGLINKVSFKEDEHLFDESSQGSNENEEGDGVALADGLPLPHGVDISSSG